MNDKDHSAESGFRQPDFPTIFGRFQASWIAPGAPILRPAVLKQRDYQGELGVIIAKTARDLSEALAHVAGWSIFNDGSIRDDPFKAPQGPPHEFRRHLRLRSLVRHR